MAEIYSIKDGSLIAEGDRLLESEGFLYSALEELVEFHRQTFTDTHGRAIGNEHMRIMTRAYSALAKANGVDIEDNFE